MVEGGGSLENESYKLSRLICGALAIILFVVGYFTDLDTSAATTDLFGYAFILCFGYVSATAIIEYLAERW